MLESATRLRELTLVPQSGICNRLRAIASARRLCSLVGADCTVLWDRGVFSRFFAPMPDVTIARCSPSNVERVVHHQPMHVDPCRDVDVSIRHVELHSGYVFWARGEPKITLADVLPFLPALSPRLQAAVDEFASQHLQGTVGMHIRRTDNKNSIAHSPDSLFFERAQQIVDSGKRIFLATDNPSTERQMRRRFGDAILTCPKRQNLSQRWPRPFDPVAFEDDLLDLFLLTRTEYILGSYWSSFSGVAIALNGSEKSEILNITDEPSNGKKAARSRG